MQLWWLGTLLVAFVCTRFFRTVAGITLGGIVLIVFGAALASDFRGAAAASPWGSRTFGRIAGATICLIGAIIVGGGVAKGLGYAH